MKTETLSKLTKSLFVFLIASLFIAPVFAYPPDNAALLYYQACSFYNPSDEMKDLLRDFATGKIDPNQAIIDHIKQNKNIIDIVLDATKIKNCDWALDYSKGLNMLMAPLGRLKASIYLVLADCRIYADKGDFKTAFQQHTSVQKMANHISEQTYVSYLVAASTSSLSNTCIQDMLSRNQPDLNNLVWLKNNFITFDQDNSFFMRAHNGEKKWIAMDMRKERVQDIIDCVDASYKNNLEKFSKEDDEFFDKNKSYYFYAMQTFEDVLKSQIPYPQKYEKLDQLTNKFGTEYKQNKDAILTASFLPAIPRIYSLGIKSQTVSNATLAALELYIVKAKTGKLPDALPTGLPKDLFSGKDFEYKKTNDGFILRCQGKVLGRALGKDEIYEYKFKVK